MKTIRNLILIAAMLAASLTARAGLQPDQVLTGGTNNVLANSTNTYKTTLFDCSKSTETTFAFTFNCGAASTANYTVAMDAAVNGVNGTPDRWITNAFMWQIAGNGASTNTYLTNLTAAQRYPFYRLSTIWNTNATTPAISNLLFQVFTKTGI
jgi:hypothetical protein